MERRRASRAASASSLRVWRLVDHWAETIGGDGMPDVRRRLHRRRAGAAAQDARHDPARHDRHRGAHAPEHRGVVADGAGQRAVRVQSADTPHGAPTRAKARRSARSRRPQTIAVLREAIDALVVMLSPFAPHTAEELWQMLGHADGLTQARRGRRSTPKSRRRRRSSCRCR